MCASRDIGCFSIFRAPTSPPFRQDLSFAINVGIEQQLFKHNAEYAQRAYTNRALLAIFYEILIQCELFDQESMER